jgi:L-aminopeptidase/D-esterase-like protein
VNATLTSVPGIRVGHASVDDGGSGCTVILGPFRGAVETRGLATGSRELGTLAVDHLVGRIDAILLTGGSAFGLAAADGVMSWLSERGLGFPTSTVPVPIVPAAVIFDLADGRGRPGSDEGRAACEAATADRVAEGRVGAGTGATVGKIGGMEGASAGGLGSAAVTCGGHRVGALVVANALGDVRDAQGGIVAGARGPSGEWLDTLALLAGGGLKRAGPPPLSPGTNTTLAVVATDAPLDRVDLGRLARMASNGLARRITPIHTPFDGDVVFAVSTGEDTHEASAAEVTALGAAAQQAVEGAIIRAVTEGPR